MGTSGSAASPAGRPPGWFSRAWTTMHRGGSAGWLLCTIAQGLLTWAFIGVSELAKGWPWERQTRLLVVVAIIATWCMALRTIRARIIELRHFWHAALAGQRTPDEHNPLGAVAWRSIKVEYARKSLLRLRIIAAGITLPFFVLPIFVSAVCVGVCWYQQSARADFLALAVFLSVLAAIVGAYFHWSIVPPRPNHHAGPADKPRKQN